MLEVAEQAARAAGEILLSEFKRPKKVIKLARHDIKLDVDCRCEDEIRRVILDRFPDHGILAEESGESAPTKSPYLWVIDPLDGTVNFYYGVPHFSVSVALKCAGETVLGIVLDPVRNEMFSAVAGEGAYLNGEPIQVSSRTETSECIACGGLSKFSELYREGADDLFRLTAAVRKVRITGSAALDICYVACGRFDLYREVSIMIWDIAAGLLIVHEAGGTTFLGTRDAPPHSFQAVASHRPVDRAFLELMRLESLEETKGRSSL